MEHDMHLSDDVDRGGPIVKVLAFVVIMMVLCGIGAYVIYGSGLWSPPIQRTSL